MPSSALRRLFSELIEEKRPETLDSKLESLRPSLRKIKVYASPPELSDAEQVPGSVFDAFPKEDRSNDPALFEALFLVTATKDLAVEEAAALADCIFIVRDRRTCCGLVYLRPSFQKRLQEVVKRKAS